MKNVSDIYKEASGYGYNLDLEATIRGSSSRLTYDDLLSFKLTGNGSSDERLSFGYTSACEISFSIDNIDGRWDDTSFEGIEWVLHQGKNISWDEEESFQVGIFTTTEALVADGAINIRATDNMRKFDQKFKGIVFPCTVYELVTQCCKQCGVTFRSSSFPNHDFVITGAYQLTQITCRKVLSLAAEICGSFAIINQFGELEFRWFDTSAHVLEYMADDVSSFKPEKDQVTLGGVSIVFNGQAYDYGSSPKKIKLTDDNRLLMFSSPQEIFTILENIYNTRLSRLSFSPASLSCIGDPAIEVGDVILVRDRKGTSYKILVSSLVLSNNLKMDITSPFLDQDDTTSSSLSESGSIPRESADAIAVHVSKNGSSALNPDQEIDNFLFQRFSAETGASPIAFITLVAECTEQGALSVDVVLDGMSQLSFSDTVRPGKYTKTIACPISGLVSGNHVLSVLLKSDSTLRLVLPSEASPKSGSIMMLQGSRIGTATSWDGLIIMAESFKHIAAKSKNVNTHKFIVDHAPSIDAVSGFDFGSQIRVSIDRPKIGLRSFSDNLSITL